jgi:hypothetical protein
MVHTIVATTNTKYAVQCEAILKTKNHGARVCTGDAKRIREKSKEKF